MTWRKASKYSIPWTSDDEATNTGGQRSHHDVHVRPKNLNEILWKATQRVAPAFRFLVADLQMAGLLDEQDHIIQPYVKLLKALGTALSPSHVDAGRPEAFELVTLLGMLAVRQQVSPDETLTSTARPHDVAPTSSSDPWHANADPWSRSPKKGKIGKGLQGKGIFVPPPVVQTVEKVVEKVIEVPQVQYVEKLVEVAPTQHVETIVTKIIEALGSHTQAAEPLTTPLTHHDRVYADAAIQWQAAEVPVEEERLHAAADAIDTTIGFSDKKLSRSDLKARAQHLIANGYDLSKITSLAEAHWGKIDNLRVGDTLVRRCGGKWYMEGSNGRGYLTETELLHVSSICARGYVQGRCPKKHEYGRVSVAEYFFDASES